MAIFKGAGVAIVTPMYEDGKVNYDKGGTSGVSDCKQYRCDHYLRNNRRIINDDAWRAS